MTDACSVAVAMAMLAFFRPQNMVDGALARERDRARQNLEALHGRTGG